MPPALDVNNPPRLIVNGAQPKAPFLSVNGGTKPLAPEPTLASKVRSAVKDYISPPIPLSLYDQANPKPQPLLQTAIQGAAKGFKSALGTPKEADVTPMIYVDAFKNALAQGAEALTKQGSIITDAHSSLLQKGAAVGDSVIQTFNTILGTALSPLQAMTKIPVVGNVADGLNGIFAAAGQGLKAPALSIVQQMVDKGTISKQTADAITPFVGDLASFGGQILLGKAASEVVPETTKTTNNILSKIQEDPLLHEAIKNDVAPTMNIPKLEVNNAPLNELTKAIQDKAPNLQYARVRDIAERAQNIPLLQQPDFIKGELAKINPNSVPAYPDFNNQRATAAETTPRLASTEATNPIPTEENQPVTQYEPYIPDGELPVIQMGTKPKGDIPTVSSETAPNVAQEALPADTRFKALSPEDQTTVRTMQRSLFGKGMDWNSAGETALARFEGQKGGSSAPLTMEPINEPSVIPEKTNISPTIKNESPKPVKSSIRPQTIKNAGVTAETPKPIERPVIDGERTTKAANDINEKLVQQGMEQLTPEQMSKYTTGSYKDSEAQSEILKKTNPEALLEMAKTGKDIPPGVHPQILYNIAEALAEERFKETKDPTLQIELARSPLGRELSEAGGTLGSHGFNDNPNSAVKIIRDINETRTKAAEKRSGKTAPKAKSDTVKEIKTEIQKNASKRPTWEEFTRELACNY